MIRKNHFTGDRKIMNMQKLGMIIQSKTSIKNALQSFENQWIRGCRAIHYANIRHGKGGMVSGIASAACKAG